MDTTISGRVSPKVLFVLSIGDFKSLRSQSTAVILPGSASPAPAGQSSCDCSGRHTAPSGPQAPLGSSRAYGGSRGHCAFGCFRSQSQRAAVALPALLQMSDPLASEGLGCRSPEARRESAGGVGDGPGMEGSQAAASGTQGRGTGGWVPPGLRAPHRRAWLGRALRSLVERPRLGCPFALDASVFAPARAPLPRAVTPAAAAATPWALGCARGYFLLFRNALVPAPLPFSDQPRW